VEPFVPDGRNAIDNLSFNQVTVPEPASLVLAGLGVLSLIARRRR
jgi:PEP-CTERM motif